MMFGLLQDHQPQGTEKASAAIIPSARLMVRGGDWIGSNSKGRGL